MSSANALRRRCGAITRAGRPCRAWAAPGSETCPAHQDAAFLAAASQPALIDEIIDDLLAKQVQLSALLEEVEETGELVRLFALYGQNASRLGRLLRDRQALKGSSADGLLAVIDQALDELSQELGITL